MGKIHSIHHQKDGCTHLDSCQAGIGHLQIQTRAEGYIQDDIDDGRNDQQSGNSLPFHESRQIRDITKKTPKNVGSRCHKKTADAQRLFRIILGYDGKIYKSFIFHVATYMKNNFVCQ